MCDIFMQRLIDLHAATTVTWKRLLQSQSLTEGVGANAGQQVAGIGHFSDSGGVLTQ